MSPKAKNRQRTPSLPLKPRSRSRSWSTSTTDGVDAVADDRAAETDEALAELPGADEDGDIGQWCALQLAQKQASGRVAHEQEQKRQFAGALQRYRVELLPASEQLVVGAVRSGALDTPLPPLPQPPLADKEWVRAANFVFETLLQYRFQARDIMDAMRHARGLGGIQDVLARLCFAIPADRLPHEMRDRLEPGVCRVSGGAKPAPASEDCGYSGDDDDEDDEEEEEEPDTPSTAVEAEAAAPTSPSVDDSATACSDGAPGEDDQLAQLVDELRVEDFEMEYAYDSDEDPGTVCGRRQVRVRALGEALEFARHHGRPDVSDAAGALMAREQGTIAALEEDLLYAADQARAEYERLWPGYHEALLAKLRRIKQLAAAAAAAEAMRAEAAAVDAPASPSCDESDGECGFGALFDGGGSSSGDEGPADGAAVGPARRVLSTAPPRGWTGAVMRELAGQLVHKYDKQATVRYRVAKCHPGTTCTFVVEWSTPAKAARIVATQRPLAATPGAGAVFAANQLEHCWTLPADLAGREARDARDLGALVFLYMQPAVSRQLATRLPPPLRGLWDEWRRAEAAAGEALAMQHRSDRIAFLRELHAQYRQACAAGGGDVDGAGGSDSDGDRAADTRRARQRQRRQSAACRLRKRLWSGKTIERRQGTAQWRAQFGAAQARLPVWQHRQAVVAAVARSRVVLVRGATGSGKSSQVPQYILRILLAGRYSGGRILCTQPRRISTMAIASRVAQELGEQVGGDRGLVGYQIRHNARCADANALVFCTAGVLLRRLIDDPMLADVKCIICDEVQERTLELDYLLIVLRRLLARRRDLCLVLMSATIDTALFSQYFDDCAVVDIPGRAFPVHSVFLERLVQLSEYAPPPNCRYMARSYYSEARLATPLLGPFNREQLAQDPDYVSPLAAWTVSQMRTEVVNLDLIQHLVRGICQGRADEPWPAYCRTKAPHGSVLVFLPGIYEIRRLAAMLQSDPAITAVASVVPLHSSFASQRPVNSTMTFSELAFAAPTAGLQRKVVLSTNVAETGITIPDVTIVIDSGLANQSYWDAACRVQRLATRPVSKANVLQRRGRAGRVQAGLALCLFGEEQFRLMPAFEQPEIHRLPLTSTCLLAKAHGARDISQFMQMAPDPPQHSAVVRAVAELQRAGALDEGEELTPIGRHLCHLPVDLSVGKLLIVGALFGCLGPILTIAASLSLSAPLLVRAPLHPEGTVGHDKYRRQAAAATAGASPHESDFMVVLAVHDDW
ncbi:hypothetical protein IWQ57_003040, partial [Coemansia nantahalensis]